MIGKLFDSDPEFYNYLSSFWSIKRHKWIKGPKLPKEIERRDNTYTIAMFEAIFVKENIDENDDVLEMSLRGGRDYFFWNLGF